MVARKKKTGQLQILPKLDVKPLITVYPLADVLQAFAAQKTGMITGLS
jgi:hypothetical protein